MHDWPPKSAASASRWSQRYSLQGGGPPAPCDELEHGAWLAIEVLLLWRGDVLAVCHRRAPCRVFVGDSGSCCDIALPSQLLGAERLCVAVASRTAVSAVLPARVTGWLTLPDGSSRAFEDRWPGQPAAEACASTERLLPLGSGQRAHLCFDELEIQVAPVSAGRASLGRRSIGFDRSTLAYFALSSLSVGGLLAVLSLLAPPLGLNPDERAAADRLYTLQQYLSAAAERATRLREETRTEPSRASAAALSRRHQPRAEVPALEQESAEAEQSYPLDVPPLAETSQLPARERHLQLEQARGFGMIALLGERLAELDDPRLRFERQLTSAELALMQQLFLDGDGLGDEGPGGLALSGTGLRAGGRANVIALAALSTLNGGEGGGLERFAELARPTGSHRPQAPSLRPADTSASDQLPAATVRRTVNRSFAQLRGCYQAGVHDESALAGNTIVHFVVQPDGHVDYVRFSGADQLPEGALECIERVFYGLSFPRPGASPVSVTYPLRLSP